MPNYDYPCKKCGQVSVLFVRYENRDNPQTCEACGLDVHRGYRTPPAVRTPKTSASFVGKHGRGLKEQALMEDIKKAAELEAKALDFNHNSREYKELKQEAAERVGPKSKEDK